MDFNDLIPQKDSPKEPTIDFTEYTSNQEEGSTFEDSKLNQSPQKTVEEPKNASILSYTEEKKENDIHKVENCSRDKNAKNLLKEEPKIKEKAKKDEDKGIISPYTYYYLGVYRLPYLKNYIITRKNNNNDNDNENENDNDNDNNIEVPRANTTYKTINVELRLISTERNGNLVKANYKNPIDSTIETYIYPVMKVGNEEY